MLAKFKLRNILLIIILGCLVLFTKSYADCDVCGHTDYEHWGGSAYDCTCSACEGWGGSGVFDCTVAGYCMYEGGKCVSCGEYENNVEMVCGCCGSYDSSSCGCNFCTETWWGYEGGVYQEVGCGRCLVHDSHTHDDSGDSYNVCSCCGQEYGTCSCNICSGCGNCTYCYGCTCDVRPSSANWYWVDSSYWRSGSIAHNGTSSSSYKTSASETGKFSFQYKVSSESSYDKLTITVTHSGGTTTVANAISGNGSWQTYTDTLSPVGGYITINATYTKDGSVDGNDDCGYIKSISFTPTHTHSYSEATCAKAATCSCGVTTGSALGHSYTGTLTCNVDGSTDTVKCIRYGTDGCTATQTQDCIHDINVTVVASTGGSVSGGTTCKAGATVTIEAMADIGYKFSSWTTNGGTLTNSALATTYLKTGSNDITVTANFLVDSYTITYNTNGGTGNTPESQVKYYGTALTLRAYAGTKAGYTFKGWSTDKDATSATWLSGGTMAGNAITSDTILYAVWVKNASTTYTVKHYQQNVDGTTYPSMPTETETLNGIIGLTVTPGVKVYDGFTSPNLQSVTLAAGTIINYYYPRNEYTLTLMKDSGISSVSGGGTYRYGQQVEVNAIVMDGYAWTTWISSNTNLLNNNSAKEYTFSMPADNITLTAISQTAIYTVTTTAGAGGRISPSTTVRSGENKNITITVNEGYKISSVTINGIQMSIKENYYLENIKENKTIVVTFTKQAQSPSINNPVVVDGMIPVRWNGENWVITTTDDKNWYNYNPTEGKWANVMLRDGTKYWSGDYNGSGTLIDIGDSDITLLKGKSIDPANEGSMFVWIPRYTYKISGSNINIKWSKGGYVDFTTNEYLVHPAFNDAAYLGGNAKKTWNYNVGNKTVVSYITSSNMLSGIWVSKYEASKDVDNHVQFKSNATSINNISIGASYDMSKAMFASNKEHYGINSAEKNIFKSHLIKNSEWAAVSYLYKAIGKDNEYAIKQINSGLNEYVCMFVEQIGAVPNRKVLLNGNSILTGNIKDVDVIRLSNPTDTSANNFASYSYYKGNAITEISSAGTGSTTVNGETSILPMAGEPFMIRTGYYGFSKTDGAAKSTIGFRTTLLIK